MRRQDKAKNMRRANMLFEQRCNEPILKEGIQHDLWDLQQKPMFGGYFYDVKFNSAMYIIFISAEPTKDIVDNNDLRKLTYYVGNGSWDYDGLEVRDENDKKILAFMEEKIKQDAPAQQAHNEKRKAEKEEAEEKARRYQR